MRLIFGIVLAVCIAGCGGRRTPEYGAEQSLYLPGNVTQVWAVAPVINLSGYSQVDPLLQADIVYQQLQQVAGLKVIPVNRVVEVYTALRLPQVQSEQQAALVCDLLGCDALLVAAVTAYDPYEPPKLGASLQLFRRGAYRRPENVDPRELVRQASPGPAATMPTGGSFVQVVGMFDAANGSVRQEVLRYAYGRNDPASPFRERLYFVEMNRFCGFVYHNLIAELLGKPQLQPGS